MKTLIALSALAFAPLTHASRKVEQVDPQADSGCEYAAKFFNGW